VGTQLSTETVVVLPWDFLDCHERKSSSSLRQWRFGEGFSHRCTNEAEHQNPVESLPLSQSSLNGIPAVLLEWMSPTTSLIFSRAFSGRFLLPETESRGSSIAHSWTLHCSLLSVLRSWPSEAQWTNQVPDMSSMVFMEQLPMFPPRLWYQVYSTAWSTTASLGARGLEIWAKLRKRTEFSTMSDIWQKEIQGKIQSRTVPRAWQRREDGMGDLLSCASCILSWRPQLQCDYCAWSSTDQNWLMGKWLVQLNKALLLLSWFNVIISVKLLIFLDNLVLYFHLHLVLLQVIDPGPMGWAPMFWPLWMMKMKSKRHRVSWLSILLSGSYDPLLILSVHTWAFLHIGSSSPPLSAGSAQANGHATSCYVYTPDRCSEVFILPGKYLAFPFNWDNSWNPNLPDSKACVVLQPLTLDIIVIVLTIAIIIKSFLWTGQDHSMVNE
jgi:hypothetical protein